jgi:hypothetical protein
VDIFNDYPMALVHNGHLHSIVTGLFQGRYNNLAPQHVDDLRMGSSIGFFHDNEYTTDTRVSENEISMDSGVGSDERQQPNKARVITSGPETQNYVLTL